MSRPQCLLPALLLAFCPVLFAQTPSWSLDGPAFTASTADVQAAAARVQPEPLTDITVLFEEEDYALTSDGRVTHTDHLIYRIEDKQGLDDWSEISDDWNPWYQNQPSLRARVFQADGRVTELDPHTLTDVPAKNEGDDTYSDARVFKGPLPSLAVGAIVEQQTVVTDKLPFFSGGSVYRVYLSRRVPVIRSRVVLEVPADGPFHIRLRSLPDSSCRPR